MREGEGERERKGDRFTGQWWATRGSLALCYRFLHPKSDDDEVPFKFMLDLKKDTSSAV